MRAFVARRVPAGTGAEGGMRRRILAVVAWVAAGLLLVAVAPGVPGGPVATSSLDLRDCSPPPGPGGTVTPVVGAVACQELTDSADLLGRGIAVPFEYYVPTGCTAP